MIKNSKAHAENLPGSTTVQEPGGQWPTFPDGSARPASFTKQVTAGQGETSVFGLRLEKRENSLKPETEVNASQRFAFTAALFLLIGPCVFSGHSQEVFMMSGTVNMSPERSRRQG